MSIGERIKEVRLKCGLTQETMANQMGIAATTLTGYEKDYRTPKSDMLVKIATICGTTVDYLLGIEIETKETEEAMFLRMFGMLDHHGKAVVKAVLDLEYERCASE